MKKLLALLLLFGIVGCEKEPSLLEKCMETNINLFETTTTGNDLKIVFQPDLNIFIDYRYSLVNKSNKDWCFIDYVDRNECVNLEAEIFFSTKSRKHQLLLPSSYAETMYSVKRLKSG